MKGNSGCVEAEATDVRAEDVVSMHTVYSALTHSFDYQR